MARCPEFQTEEGVELAISEWVGVDMGGLVVIGGNGSQAGVKEVCNRELEIV